jgi:hypothetical protein
VPEVGASIKGNKNLGKPDAGFHFLFLGKEVNVNLRGVQQHGMKFILNIARNSTS